MDARSHLCQRWSRPAPRGRATSSLPTGALALLVARAPLTHLSFAVLTSRTRPGRLTVGMDCAATSPAATRLDTSAQSLDAAANRRRLVQVREVWRPRRRTLHSPPWLDVMEIYTDAIIAQ